MREDVKIVDSQFTDESGITWELRYYIKIYEEGTDNAAYGIKVEKVNTNLNKKTSEETKGLTHSYKEAEELAQKLATCTVTPITLHSIIDDLIG